MTSAFQEAWKLSPHEYLEMTFPEHIRAGKSWIITQTDDGQYWISDTLASPGKTIKGLMGFVHAANTITKFPGAIPMKRRPLTIPMPRRS